MLRELSDAPSTPVCLRSPTLWSMTMTAVGRRLQGLTVYTCHLCSQRQVPFEGFSLLRARQSLGGDPCSSLLDSTAHWLLSSPYAHFVNAPNFSFRKTTSLPNTCNSSVKFPNKPLCSWNRETWPRDTGSLLKISV